jgi:hypothetical protein
VFASKLHDDVKQVIDPQGRGRHYVVSQLEKHSGTRVGGFVLERQAAAGKWGKATYAIKTAYDNKEDRGHRGDEDHGSEPITAAVSGAPYAESKLTAADSCLENSQNAAAVEPAEIAVTARSPGARGWSKRI